MRELSEKLLFNGRRAPDRMRMVVVGLKGMNEYVNLLVEERMANPKNDFISVLANGEKTGFFTREQVLGNTALLLIAGHETTINLTCNGTLSFMNNRDQ